MRHKMCSVYSGPFITDEGRDGGARELSVVRIELVRNAEIEG